MNDSNAQKNETKYSLQKVSTIIAIIGAFIGALNIFTSNMYAIQCENFYQIPRKYFHTTIYDILILWMLFILLIILFFFYITKFKKQNHATTSTKVSIKSVFSWLFPDGLLILVFAFAIGALVSLYTPFIGYIPPLKSTAIASICTKYQFILFLVYFIVGFFLISSAFFPKYLSWIMHTRIAKTIYTFILTFFIFVILNGICIQTTKDVTIQQNYEKIYNSNYLVLSDINSSQKLIASYYEKCGEYIINTSSYRIINSDSYSYTFISFPKAPKVEK